MATEQKSGSGSGGFARQVTMRMERALHSRLKKALAERDIKFQPLAVWLIEFWLNNPNFQKAATALAENPIPKRETEMYADTIASPEDRRLAKVFGEIEGGESLKRKVVALLEEVATVQKGILARLNDESRFDKFRHELDFLQEQIEHLRLISEPARPPAEGAGRDKSRHHEEAGGSGSGRKTTKATG